MSRDNVFTIIGILTGLILVVSIKHVREVRIDLAQTKSELRIAKDREAAFSAETDRLMGKLIGCEQKQDAIEELQSDLTFKNFDLAQCKRDLDHAMDFGVKCLKKSLSLADQLRRRKQ